MIFGLSKLLVIIIKPPLDITEIGKNYQSYNECLQFINSSYSSFFFK